MIETLPCEKWKPILGYKYLYFVSSQGRIASSAGKGCCRRSRKYSDPFLLTQTLNSTGYYRVNLKRLDGKNSRVFVHRLVAEAFIENPNGYKVVNHKDFNPKNNTTENLEWTTPYGNYKYSFDRGRFNRTQEWRRNLKNSLSKVQGIPVIGTNIDTGEERYYENLNDVSDDGFQPSCVCGCCKGTRKTHKGFIWRYGNDE